MKTKLVPRKIFLKNGFGGGKIPYKRVENMSQTEMGNLYNMGFSHWFDEIPVEEPETDVIWDEFLDEFLKKDDEHDTDSEG